MLYDPKWEPKVNPYSLESLIEWLEKQPANATYHWAVPSDCLLGQFARSRGMTDEREIAAKSLELAEPLRFGFVALGQGPFTFGAALERALKMR